MANYGSGLIGDKQRNSLRINIFAKSAGGNSGSIRGDWIKNNV